MKFILGKKLNMTSVFQDGKMTPVTLVKAGPCFVTQIKNKDKDTYDAIQLGFDTKKKATKAMKGHLKGLVDEKSKKVFKHLREFRLTEGVEKPSRGAEIDINTFQKGDVVKVIGISKGHGFTGVVKRHKFHGHPPTHGHKDQERMPGSIGSGGIQRVFKGLRMAGRWGNDSTTVDNLEIIEIKPEENILYLNGSLPGSRNSLLKIICPKGDLKIKSNDVQKEDTTKQEETAEVETVEIKENADVIKTDKPEEKVEENKPVEETV
jgi:large subunit ribosomal protein L3